MPETKDFLIAWKKQCRCSDQLKLFQSTNFVNGKLSGPSLETGAVKAYDEIMKRGFTQENLMDLYLQNPNNIFFKLLVLEK